MLKFPWELTEEVKQLNTRTNFLQEVIFYSFLVELSYTCRKTHKPLIFTEVTSIHNALTIKLKKCTHNKAPLCQVELSYTVVSFFKILLQDNVCHVSSFIKRT